MVISKTILLLFLSLWLVRPSSGGSAGADNHSGFCKKILAPASRSRTQAGSPRRSGDPTSGNDINMLFMNEPGPEQIIDNSIIITE